MKQFEKLSVVLPCYKEADNLPSMLEALQNVLDQIPGQKEILAIDDGSPDNTYETLLSLKPQYPDLHIIRFARNFGKEAALTCGLNRATGDITVMLDSDLQHPPAVILQMLQKWKAGAEMVYALRRTREGDGWLRRVLTKVFYWLFKKISELELPPGAGDFRLMEKKVVSAINQLPERNRFMKGLMTWVGFKCEVVYFEAPVRQYGESRWPLKDLFKLALDGIAAFSIVPLRVWSFCGAIISLCALLYMAFLVIRTSIFGVDIPGYASLMCSVLLIGGIQLISLGIIGEYIGRIFHEVKGRPIYLISADHPAQPSQQRHEVL